MPTYEYECRECGKTFEAVQRMTDEPLTECIQCRGPVRRLISMGSGVIIKGGSTSSSPSASGSSCAGCTAGTCASCHR